MCARMTAHHLPCAHTHTWFARCFRAKWKRQPSCKTCVPAGTVMKFLYQEEFMCPSCRWELKGLRGRRS